MERRVALVGLNLTLLGLLASIYGVQSGMAQLIGAGAGLASAGLVIIGLALPAGEARLEALDIVSKSLSNGLSWILADMGLERPWITAVPVGERVFVVYHAQGSAPSDPQPGPGPGPSLTIVSPRVEVDPVDNVEDLGAVLYQAIIDRMSIAESLDVEHVPKGLHLVLYGLRQPFRRLAGQPASPPALILAVTAASSISRPVTVRDYTAGPENVEATLIVGEA